MPDAHERLLSETAHVLFLDLVGHSRLPIEQQARHVRELGQTVRAAPEFERGTLEGELLCLDRGDGLALVFFRDPVAPVRCAVQVARALRSESPHLAVRMGVHSGPVSRVEGLSGQGSVFGGGINGARRVMDCADAGHILVSGPCAESLRQFEGWNAALHDLGECAVKHGERVRLFNLYAADFGSPARPRACAAPAPTQDSPAGPEPTGGAVPLDSPFYVVRPADTEFVTALRRGDSVVLVKGARQVGKTSLLARGLQRARQDGARVVATDFQALDADAFQSPDALCLALAERLSEQLELDPPTSDWSPLRGPNANLERFLKRQALAPADAPLIWAFDEADRLFPCPFGSQIFGLFRSWHNRRALDPGGPWSRLTLALAYATEAHLFISDLNQSPFNVGTRLVLADFDLARIADLNARHGSPLSDAGQVARLHDLVGGQPYLVRRALAELAADRLDLPTLEAQAPRDDGPFADHLRRLLVALTQDPELTQAVRALLQSGPDMTPEHFLRLRGAGVLSGDAPQTARVRCRLYAEFLARRLSPQER